MSEKDKHEEAVGWVQLLTNIFILILGPFMTIVSLNHLFNTDIGFSIASWVTTAWLMSVIMAFKNMGRKNE